MTTIITALEKKKPFKKTTMKKICPICKNEFDAERISKTYCSDRCRKQAFLQKQDSGQAFPQHHSTAEEMLNVNDNKTRNDNKNGISTDAQNGKEKNDTICHSDSEKITRSNNNQNRTSKQQCFCEELKEFISETVHSAVIDAVQNTGNNISAKQQGNNDGNENDDLFDTNTAEITSETNFTQNGNDNRNDNNNENKNGSDSNDSSDKNDSRNTNEQNSTIVDDEKKYSENLLEREDEEILEETENQSIITINDDKKKIENGTPDEDVKNNRTAESIAAVALSGTVTENGTIEKNGTIIGNDSKPSIENDKQLPYKQLYSDFLVDVGERVNFRDKTAHYARPKSFFSDEQVAHIKVASRMMRCLLENTLHLSTLRNAPVNRFHQLVRGYGYLITHPAFKNLPEEFSVSEFIVKLHRKFMWLYQKYSDRKTIRFVIDRQTKSEIISLIHEIGESVVLRNFEEEFAVMLRNNFQH